MKTERMIKKQCDDLLNRSLFYLASFGAASVDALIVLFLLNIILGNQMTILSFYWVFLFLFPGMLVFARFFIARALGRGHAVSIHYGIISGYGAYALLSLAILMFDPQADPVNWFVLVLGVSTLAVFSSDWMFRGVGYRNEVDGEGGDGQTSTMPSVIEMPQRPVLLIHAPGSNKDVDSKNKSKDR